ncbi:MAG: hypothetical protein AAF555_07375 [Verrucomicrobiota bacterium]
MRLTEEQMVRWLDGELSDSERAAVEALASADPELQAWKQSDDELRSALRERFSASEEPAYPDLFQHQLRRRLEEEATRPRGWKQWFQRVHPFTLLGLPWAVAAASLMLLAVFVFSDQHREKMPVLSSVAAASAYSPVPGISAEAFFSPTANATVIVLDGWEPLEEEELAGLEFLFDEAEGGPPSESEALDELAVLSLPY